MSGYVNKSGLYDCEEFGLVHINVKRTARNVSARWKAGRLYVSAPLGIEYDRLIGILRGLAPRIEQIRPDNPYFIGQVLEWPGFRVEISAQSHAPEHVLGNFDDTGGRIEVGSSWDINSSNTIVTISKFICRMAQTRASEILLPRARELSAEVGKMPLMWKISNGHRTLGRCDSQGVISLSYVLMLYPQHLRDYVVFHELAHLSEMNHSPRFHQLCDVYCKGREKELEAQLRAYRVPLAK